MICIGGVPGRSSETRHVRNVVMWDEWDAFKTSRLECISHVMWDDLPAPMNHVKHLRASPAEMPFQSLAHSRRHVRWRSRIRDAMWGDVLCLFEKIKIISSKKINLKWLFYTLSHSFNWRIGLKESERVWNNSHLQLMSHVANGWAVSLWNNSHLQ